MLLFLQQVSLRVLACIFKETLMREYNQADHILNSFKWPGLWHELALVGHGEDEFVRDPKPAACVQFRKLLNVMTYVDQKNVDGVTSELVEMYGTVQLYMTAIEHEFLNNYRAWSFEDTGEGD